MRSHKTIASGIDPKTLGLPASTVRSWRSRNSIPGWAWAALARTGIADLEELAMGADRVGHHALVIHRPEDFVHSVKTEGEQA
jgi:hypothetical protein